VVASGIGMTLSFGVADLALTGGSVSGFRPAGDRRVTCT